MKTKLRTAEWVSDFLGVKLARVYELTRQDRIPFVRLGERQYRYSEQALIKWIENGGTREAGDKNGVR